MELRPRPLAPDPTAVGNGVADQKLTSRSRLLDGLPPAERARVMMCLQRVHLAPRQVLHHANLPMQHVYFIESGLVSVMAKISDRRPVEVWLIGSGGVIGLPVLLGDPHPPFRRVVQIGGTALRMTALEFRRVLRRSDALRDILLRHTQLVLLRTSQSGACNAQHSVKQRLARWLLLARDGLESDQIAMPQELLARLIGVRRATISDCLKEIEGQGAIRRMRRLIEITDDEALESLSCDCYRSIMRERKRLLGF